jgi:hypothetical protein
MYLVKGMRSEYHSITDTLDVHNIIMDAIKRDICQKGMRIESRSQSFTAEPQTHTAFATSDDATTKLLKRKLSELQEQLKYLQGATTTRRASYGKGAARMFVVFAMAVVRRAIASPSARTTTPEVTLRMWTPPLLFRRS